MINCPAPPRIDWLDGWRAIAVVIVILAHLGGLEHWTSAPPGKLGVFIFFGISGFIVTRLLLGERARTGEINIPAFFIRRAARILPPLLLYLAICVAIGQASAGAAVRAVLFTCNVAKGPWDCGWTFGHTWSLSFEEQYYLIVPFLLAGRARWLFVPIALALSCHLRFRFISSAGSERYRFTCCSASVR
jgi:peptidoglycan/LPS O-acetylase OafA/YrhL